MAEGEAEEDDAPNGDPVLSEVTSGIVPSAGEVLSGTVRSRCAQAVPMGGGAAHLRA
jgi:hypothetical protein